MKILYIEPNEGNKIYYHYNTLGIGLSQSNCNVHHVSSIQDHNFNKYDLIIMGYGACCRDWFQQNLTTKTPIIVFLYKLSCNKNEKFRAIKNYPNIIPFSQHTRIPEFEKKYQIKLNPTLYPFDERIFYDYKLEKKYDVGMTGALHGAKHYANEAFLEGEKNIRLKIVNKLKNSALKKFIKVNDNGPKVSRIINHIDYAKNNK